MQAIGLTKTNGAVKAKSSLSARGRILHGRLARMKSGEILMEVHSNSDLQINRRSWV